MLNPCPFCGREELTFHLFGHECGKEYCIECIRCHTMGPTAETKEDAVQKWNYTINTFNTVRENGVKNLNPDCIKCQDTFKKEIGEAYYRGYEFERKWLYDKCDHCHRIKSLENANTEIEKSNEYIKELEKEVSKVEKEKKILRWLGFR